MLQSALSMPPTGKHRPDRSHYSRSTSQPPTAISSAKVPMRTFLENLLHLGRREKAPNSTSSISRSKVVSSLSVCPPTDRSARVKTSRNSTLLYAPSSTTIRPSPTLLTLKFRRVGKLILFSIYWCKLARQKNLLLSEQYRSYLQTRPSNEARMFDVVHFKIQSHEILPHVRQFFQQPAGVRSLQQAEQVRKSLADVKPFTRLPRTLQDRVLQRAWYECHPAGQTIVRQDLQTTCFYIILSGLAIPTYKRSAEETTETLEVLKRGSTFGERALITDSRQTFTITSETQLELMVLWKDDFKSIFLTSDRHCSKEDLRFLKNDVPFLTGFPIDQLNQSSEAIQHCHFRMSEVIARDSRKMKHIFVVQKGSLSIWKRLEPNSFDPISGKFVENSSENPKFIQEEDEATGDDKVLFSEIKMNENINTSMFGSAKLDADFRLSRLRRRNIDDQRVLSPNSGSTQTLADNQQKLFPGLLDKRDRLQTVDYDTIPMTNDKTKLSLPLASTEKKLGSKSKLLGPEKMIYVHVRTLNEGQHFGLADMIFPNQPFLTLVSNGCECLLLHKASFMEIASEPYKQNLRRTEIPFPSDVAFYKTFHSNEMWQRLRKKAYIDAYRRCPTNHENAKRRSIQQKVRTNFDRCSIFIDPF